MQLEDGRRLAADFFVDCSGFRSELLGKRARRAVRQLRSLALLRPRRRRRLGADRRADPPLHHRRDDGRRLGWQIEHEHHVNRGYVYSSRSISDDEAAAEFLRKNPQGAADRRAS